MSIKEPPKGIKDRFLGSKDTVSDIYGAFMGNGSFVSMAEKYLKNKSNGETDDKLKAAINAAKAFEGAGGFQELYKGFNSIRDTMFVNGAPQDWKNTAKEMDENKKRKDDAKAFNFTHDEGNRKYIIKEMNLEAKAAAKYPGDKTKQTDWIDSKVEKELNNLAQNYVQLGVDNVETAYKASQLEKKYGYTPLQAYVNYAKGVSNDRAFEMFNVNQSIINEVNNTTQGNYSSVSEAIPNAKDFWDNGYRNIEYMQDAQMIKDKLSTTLDMAMKLEQVLRDKGKATYTGNDKDIEKTFKEINEYYEKKYKMKK